MDLKWNLKCKMSRYLLTYEDAQEIAKKYNNNNFWESQHMLNGFKVSTFNYFICGWNDFENPLPNKPHVNAFDMRGTTFTFDKNGKVVERFFMLSKFFNLNQVDATQYDKVKNKKILDINAKEDGSLVAFMELPDERIFAKTIGSFVSDQSQAAYKFLCDWPEKVAYVKQVLRAGYTPLFEYVSGPNRIVLKYAKEDLRFLGLRANTTGEWMPASMLNPMRQIPFTTPETLEVLPLKNLLEKAKVEQNKEGWVVRFADGQIIKIKTAWYFQKHKCRDNLDREHKIIEMILDETIDDAISEFDEPIFTEKVEKIQNIINLYIKEKTREINELCQQYTGDIKKFAIENNSNKVFHLAIQHLTYNRTIKSILINFLLKRTAHLKKAVEFIERGVI